MTASIPDRLTLQNNAATLPSETNPNPNHRIPLPATPNSASTKKISNAEWIDPKDPKEIQKAIESFSCQLEKNPKSTATLINRAEHYLVLKEWDKAEKDFKMAFMQDMQNPRILKGLGEVAFHKMDYENACKRFTKALDLSHTDLVLQNSIKFLLTYALVQLNISLGRASFQKQNYGEALRYFSIAYKETPEKDALIDDIETLINTAFSALSEEYEKLVAEKKLEEASNLVDFSDDVHDSLSDEDKILASRMNGKIYLKRNCYARAKDFFRGSKVPEDIDHLGQCQFRSANYDFAAITYEGALNNSKINLTHDQREDFYTKAIINSLFANCTEKYTELLRRFTQEFPQSINFKLIKGLDLYLKIKNPAQRNEHLRECARNYQAYLKEKPGCYYGNILFARNLLDGKYYSEVVGLLTEALRRDPYNFLARELRAVAYEELGKLKESMDDNHECVKDLLIDRDANIDTFENRLVLCDYAYLIHFHGRTDEALKILDRLVALDESMLEDDQPRTFEINFNYAKIYFDTKKYIDAVRQLSLIPKNSIKDQDSLMVRALIAIGTPEELKRALSICLQNKGQSLFDDYKQIIDSKINDLKNKPKNPSIPTSPASTGTGKKKRSSKQAKEFVVKESAEDQAKREAEEAQKKAAAEVERLENLKKLEEASLKRIAEEKAREKAEKERKKIEAEIKAANKRELAQNILQPSSGSGRNGKLEPKRKERIPPAASVANKQENEKKTKSADKPVQSAPIPTLVTNNIVSEQPQDIPTPVPPVSKLPPPPAIRVFQETLGAAKIAPPRPKPQNSLEPIGNHLKTALIQSTPIPESLTDMQVEHIKDAETILVTIELILKAPKYNLELNKKLLLQRLRDFIDSINQAKGDLQFARNFERIMNHHTFEKLGSYIHSSEMEKVPMIEEFCRSFLNSYLCNIIRDLHEKKVWPLPKQNNPLRARIGHEIHLLSLLSKAPLNIAEGAFFKSSLRGIVGAAKKLNDEISLMLFISSLESFLNNPFSIDRAQLIAERLTGNKRLLELTGV